MPETVKCRACDAAVIFAKNRATGALLPLDAESRGDGKVVLHADGTCTVLSKRTLFDGPPPEGTLHVTHFATCTDPQRFRRRGA